MGYYSDVGLCLSAKGKGILDNSLAELEKSDSEKFEQVKELIDAATKREDEETGAISYYWESLKWYPDFPDVAFFESVIQTLEYEEDYLFIQLGEHDDDIKYQGGFWDNPFNMCFVRSIVFDD
jgi:hypothetical protein